MANIKQVAQHAGLSPSCVSKYLRDSDSVRAENRHKIEQAIAELNYAPSNIARSLRQGRSMNIKAIMPSITLPFFAEIFEYLRAPLATAGYHLLLQTITPNESFSLRNFLDVDGVIVAFPDSDNVIQELSDLLRPTNKPLVTMHGTSSAPDVRSVIVDICDGMAQAASYLINNGRKKIAFVGGGLQSSPSSARFLGFSQIIPPELQCGVYRRDFSMDWGYTAAAQMVASQRIPDGVLCENDGIAAGVIKYMLTHGISVPGEVWVIGFDNIPLSKMYTPSISSVSIPSLEMSRDVVRILFDALQTNDFRCAQYNATLVIRQSSQ